MKKRANGTSITEEGYDNEGEEEMGVSDTEEEGEEENVQALLVKQPRKAKKINTDKGSKPKRKKA